MTVNPIKGRKLFDYLKNLITELPNPESINLDRLSTVEILELINREDASVALVVRQQIPEISKAVEMTYKALRDGGRLIYIGAGTSGRLGVLDAAECPPTFGTSPEQIIGLVAGGPPTLIRSAEGVEDNEQAGEIDIDSINTCSKDIVVGLTASRRTPYVISGLNRASDHGAKTILICCNPPDDKYTYDYDLIIIPVVGPEVLAGSTRMKAALAEKMILTMLTTTIMVKLGKVYKNLMVDFQATSEKLVERSKRVIMDTVDCDYTTAGKLLEKADGHVKSAIIIAKLGCDLKTARELLNKHNGIIYKVIDKT